MKRMDETCLTLSRFQADLFELSSKKGVPSSSFIEAFAKSDLAKRMDDIGFIFESCDLEKALGEIKTNKKGNKEIYPTYVMSWIGYLYRQWAYTYELSSLDIFIMYDLNELYGLYQAYHSLDVKEAISRLYESSINKNRDDISLLKKIMKV